jgi:hypothetical protein
MRAKAFTLTLRVPQGDPMLYVITDILLTAIGLKLHNSSPVSKKASDEIRQNDGGLARGRA